MLASFLFLTATAVPPSMAAPPEVACATASSPADLLEAVVQVETGFSRLDKSSVLFHASFADRLLPCLDRPLGPLEAARLHRARGLRLFLEKNPEAAALEFAASRRLDPSPLPASLAPPGNPLLVTFSALEITNLPTRKAPATPGAHWLFDGRNDLRPTTLPTFAQLLDSSGAVLQTRTLAPTDPLPVLPEPGVLPETATIPVAVGPESASLRKGPLVGATVSGLAAATFCGLAWHATQVHAASEDPTVLETVYRRDHLYVVGAGLTGAAALGLVVAGVW